MIWSCIRTCGWNTGITGALNYHRCKSDVESGEWHRKGDGRKEPHSYDVQFHSSNLGMPSTITKSAFLTTI
jgi:hypothetical protein